MAAHALLKANDSQNIPQASTPAIQFGFRGLSPQLEPDTTPAIQTVASTTPTFPATSCNTPHPRWYQS